MGNFYSIDIFKRSLSLAVLPIDSFTGSASKGKSIEVIVKELNTLAVAKNDGYHVFSDLPKGDWTVCVKSEEFFNETLKVSISGKNEIINLPLIPCAGYKLPSGSTYIDCAFLENTMAWFIPEAPVAKLKSINKDTISLRMRPSRNLSKVTVAFRANNEMEMFELGDSIADNTYLHSLALIKEHKAGEELFLVTTGKADNTGRLFCPIKGFSSTNKNVLMRYEQDGKAYHESFEITYGRGNNISLCKAGAV